MPAPRQGAPRYDVRRADWRRDESTLRAVRREVFVEEQGVSELEEWDGQDAQCAHVLAFTEKREPVGTGRLTPSGKLGRIAVIKAHRGRGVGGRIVDELVREARRQGLHRVCLHAQVHALRFYERHGFTATGREFLEANIPHVAMQRTLNP